MKEVYEAGYRDGVLATENKNHGVDDFLNADGKPTWEAVALFLQRNKHRLDVKHHEFIDKMAGRTAWARANRTDAQIPAQPFLPTRRKNKMSTHIDEAAVRQFIEIICAHAAQVINGGAKTGVLELSRINPADEKVPRASRFSLNDIDEMVKTAIGDARPDITFTSRVAPCGLTCAAQARRPRGYRRGCSGWSPIAMPTRARAATSPLGPVSRLNHRPEFSSLVSADP